MSCAAFVNSKWNPSVIFGAYVFVSLSLMDDMCEKKSTKKLMRKEEDPSTK